MTVELAYQDKLRLLEVTTVLKQLAGMIFPSST